MRHVFFLAVLINGGLCFFAFLHQDLNAMAWSAACAGLCYFGFRRSLSKTDKPR